MRCPFLKFSFYTAGSNTGGGYPDIWKKSEEFEECIGEECQAYYVEETFYPESKKGACALCKKK